MIPDFSIRTVRIIGAYFFEDPSVQIVIHNLMNFSESRTSMMGRFLV